MGNCEWKKREKEQLLSRDNFPKYTNVTLANWMPKIYSTSLFIIEDDDEQFTLTLEVAIVPLIAMVDIELDRLTSNLCGSNS